MQFKKVLVFVYEGTILILIQSLNIIFMSSKLKTPHKILIIALSGIGNLLMQSPAINQIRRAFPESHITLWVAPRGTKVIAEANPWVDQVIEASLKQSWLDHIQLCWKLLRQRFDTGIVLSPGQRWKSAAYMFLAGIRQRLGHTYPWRGNSHSKFLFTQAINEQAKLHDVEQNLNLLSLLDYRIQHQKYPLRYEIIIPETKRQQADHLYKTFAIPSDKMVIGFHMGCAANMLFKRWPIQRFIEVGQSLITKNNAHILLFGGLHENGLKRTAKTALGVNSTVVSADLLATASLMQRCRLFLSNDSGLMHLAAAVGVKTYGLFGPTDERKTGPRGKDSHIIRASGTNPVYDTENNFDLGPTTHETLLSLSASQVLDIISKTL